MTRLVIFILLTAGTVALNVTLHLFLLKSLTRHFELTRTARRVATAGVAASGIAIQASLVFSRLQVQSLPRELLSLPLIWAGTLIMATTLIVIAEVCLRAGFAAYRRVMNQAVRPDLLRQMHRGAIIAIGCLLIPIAARSVHQAALPRVQKTEVRLARLPASFDGLRVVQLTDLHLGATLDGAWLREVVAAVNGQRPDLVVITGDLLDRDAARNAGELTALRELRAPLGVYFVTGNHEYFANVTALLPALNDLGVRVLRNERVALERNNATIDLLGIDDCGSRGLAPGHGPDLAAALRGHDPRRESILLSHQPRIIGEAAAADIGLVLAGHTHGGQIWPIHYTVFLHQPYLRGLNRHGGARTQIYVSDGTGYWGPPVRLGSASEISLIILRRAAESVAR